jgi:DNA-binding NarL/FixJ family response regulator
MADVILAAGLPRQQIPRAGAPVVVVADRSVEQAGFEREIRAWLPSDSSAAELAAALLAVANDLVVLTPDQARRWLRPQPEENENISVEALTPRELEVLRTLADGLGNKEIAQQLGISEHTAKFHVAQILAKFGAHSRAEAVALGIRRGLVPI